MQGIGDGFCLIGSGVNISGVPVSAASLGTSSLALLAPTGGGGEMYYSYPSATMNSDDMNISQVRNIEQINCNGYSCNASPPELCNQNKPFLTIEEQPVSRIRFRYKSEKGSHGGLTGRNTSLSKTYPTVKLHGSLGNKEIRIQASLYTCEANPRRHVHKLMGRECNDEGICTVPLREDKTAVFQNLGILFSGKKEVPEILFRRKLEQHGYHSLNIPDSVIKTIRDEAESEAREINLNCVKICFEAFILNPQLNRCEIPLCDRIFSDAISNQKSPDSGELKIVKMDRYSGSCIGNEEVFLLCEKVNKKEIKIRFYEMNTDGELLWEGFGSFGEADVHHQVAIVFRTPPYKNTEIENPVTVCVQLFRKKDGECSEPKSFVYKPVVHDEEGIERKRKKMNHYQPLPGDYQSHHNEFTSPPGFLGGGTENSGFGALHYAGHSPYYHRNLPFVEEDVSDFQPYGNVFSSGSAEESLFHCNDPVLSSTNEFCLSSHSTLEETLAFIQKDSSVSSSLDKDGDKIASFESLTIKDDAETSQDIPSKKFIESCKTSLREEATLPSKSACLQHRSLKDAENFLMPLGKEEKIYNKTPVSNYPAPNSESAKAQCSRNQEDITSRLTNITNFYSIRKVLSMQSLLALRHFVASANITHLLSNMRHLIAVQDEDGDTILHLAVIHQPHQYYMMSSLLQAARSLPYNIVNYTNNLKQSPLHLAVLSKSHHLVKILLKYGADPTLQDRKGDTAFHLASKHKYCQCLSELLCMENYTKFAKSDTGRNLTSLHLKRPNLDILNYDGYSALHMSSIQGCKDCVHYLCSAGADLNALDGTSGRTALHLAVEHNHTHIIKYLLSMSGSDVDIQDFAGNTPLHLACGRNMPEIVSQLMQANANPLMENYDQHFNNDLHKAQGKTPYDLACNNKQIEAILGGKHLQRSELKISDTGRTDSGYNSSSHISFLDDNTLKKLCQLLDPPSADWEMLAIYLGLEEPQINDIKKLGGNCTASVIKYFEAKCEEPEYDIKKLFINALETADLQEALQVVTEGLSQ